jgi:aspartyl-tRNA synthetase
MHDGANLKKGRAARRDKHGTKTLHSTTLQYLGHGVVRLELSRATNLLEPSRMSFLWCTDHPCKDFL